MIAPVDEELVAASYGPHVTSTDEEPGMPVGEYVHQLTYRGFQGEPGFFEIVSYRLTDSTELPRGMYPATTRRGARLARREWARITGEYVPVPVAGGRWGRT